jgi:hypothetical protein
MLITFIFYWVLWTKHITSSNSTTLQRASIKSQTPKTLDGLVLLWYIDVNHQMNRSSLLVLRTLSHSILGYDTLWSIITGLPDDFQSQCSSLPPNILWSGECVLNVFTVFLQQTTIDNLISRSYQKHYRVNSYKLECTQKRASMNMCRVCTNTWEVWMIWMHCMKTLSG